MEITADQVIPLLLQAAPGFGEAWQKHLEYWNGQERGSYNDVAEFAHYLVASYAAGNTTEFPATFRTIERLIEEGNQQTRDLAIIGVLEDIQNIASHSEFDNKVFIEWLGPRSREAWGQIERMWVAGGGSLGGVIRLERKVIRQKQTPWWKFWIKVSKT